MTSSDLLGNSAIYNLLSTAQTVNSDWKWADDQSLIFGSSSDYSMLFESSTLYWLFKAGSSTIFRMASNGQLTFFNGNGLRLVNAVPIYFGASSNASIQFDGTNWAFTGSPVISGAIENNTFSAGYNETSPIGVDTVIGATWTTITPTSGIIITYVSSDFTTILLNIIKIHLEVLYYRFIFKYGINTTKDATAMDIRWQYSVDGGTTWTTVATDTSIATGGDGGGLNATGLSATSVDIDGSSITGDVMVRTQAQVSGGSAVDDTLNVNVTNGFSVKYSVAIKTQ